MFPTQITLRNLRRSPDLTVRVRDLCEKLGHVHPRILSCRVAIEHATPSFLIEIQVRLPALEIVCPQQKDVDIDAALRRAFSATRRQLREAVLVDRPALAG